MAGSSSTIAMRRPIGGAESQNGADYTTRVGVRRRKEEVVRSLPELIGRMTVLPPSAARVGDLNASRAGQVSGAESVAERREQQHARKSGTDGNHGAWQ